MYDPGGLSTQINLLVSAIHCLRGLSTAPFAKHGDALGERGVTVISKRSCRSVYAKSFELLAHGVGDGNLTTIGEHDRRAARRVQREKLQPWLDLRHFREQRGDVFERIAFT